MGDRTGIEWTEATWNPVVGCTHVSPGCDNCYAAREASTRLAGVPVYAGLAAGGRFTGEVRCLPERLDQPIRWRKPRRIFVNSMSDLFHRDIPDDFICRVFDVMAAAPQHTFQVLTKRPQRMARLFGNDDSVWDRLGISALPNVWLGISVESDRYSFRTVHVRDIDAAVRWLSIEPLIGALPVLDLTGIGWVVVGGESGSGARMMDLGWARDVRDRCAAAGVPFFMKQLGAVQAQHRGMTDRAGKAIGEFPSDLQIREYPDGR